jgi:hypothetical protein
MMGRALSPEVKTLDCTAYDVASTLTSDMQNNYWSEIPTRRLVDECMRREGYSDEVREEVLAMTVFDFFSGDEDVEADVVSVFVRSALWGGDALLLADQDTLCELPEVSYLLISSDWHEDNSIDKEELTLIHSSIGHYQLWHRVSAQELAYAVSLRRCLLVGALTHKEDQIYSFDDEPKYEHIFDYVAIARRHVSDDSALLWAVSCDAYGMDVDEYEALVQMCSIEDVMLYLDAGVTIASTIIKMLESDVDPSVAHSFVSS